MATSEMRDLFEASNIPIITAALVANPDTKMVGYPGGQMLGNVPAYMQAAGKKAGDIFNFGFDTSPQIVEAFKAGWVQLTADQQPFLQGYLPILSLCQQVVYGLAPLNVDTGAGFVTLAATLAIVPDIPIQSIAIILGIDKFMSECRALTNLVGNGVATVVISRWEGELDVDKLHETMAHPIAVGEEMEALPI